MADSGDVQEGIIFTWKIKNISCFQGKQFFSSDLKGFQKTEWLLKLVIDCDVVKCSLSQLNVGFLEDSKFTSDMTFISGKNSYVASYPTACTFTIGSPGSDGSVNRSYLTVGYSNSISLVRDLTIRCRLWRGETCPSVFSHCHAFTEFDAHFSSFECSVKQTTNGSLLLTESRRHDEFENKFIEIRSSLSETALKFETIFDSDIIPKLCTCHIYLKQNKEVSLLWLKEAVKPATYAKGQPWTFSLSFNWNKFVLKKKNHFRDDVITLRLEFLSSSGKLMSNYTQPSTSSVTLDGSDDLDVTMKKAKSLNFSLLPMFQNGILCDVQLKTTTKTFPAHKLVLSANSSVFLAMFTSDMKEKASNIVEISDIEERVMERLLHYAYSGDVGEMTWDFALKLYYAANKYQMNLLKNECSVYLSENLSLKNICEALVFFEKHNDNHLQQSVLNFITLNTSAVFDSEEWKDLENKETKF